MTNPDPIMPDFHLKDLWLKNTLAIKELNNSNLNNLRFSPVIKNKSFMKRSWIYGFLLFAGFLLYFLIMRGLGLYTDLNLRVFNIVIHSAFIYLAIRSYYLSHPEKQTINYVKGALAGIRPGVIGVALFGLFQLIYLHFDETLMQSLQDNEMVGTHLNPFTATGIVLFEGLATTIILSYILMRIVDAQLDKKYLVREEK